MLITVDEGAEILLKLFNMVRIKDDFQSNGKLH
jgi:hypothetical protein